MLIERVKAKTFSDREPLAHTSPSEQLTKRPQEALLAKRIQTHSHFLGRGRLENGRQGQQQVVTKYYMNDIRLIHITRSYSSSSNWLNLSYNLLILQMDKAISLSSVPGTLSYSMSENIPTPIKVFIVDRESLANNQMMKKLKVFNEEA